MHDSEEKSASEKLGNNAVWSMAVGGMVGGGIFSVLGVVIELAGVWAWLSFVIAGLIALATGFSYVHLAAKYGESGGAFTFLREVHHEKLAGSLSWVLIYGYILTNAVYAFTFGHYLGEAFGLGDVLTRVFAVAIIAVLMGGNILGVGEAAKLEIVAVWGKLIVLLGLACFGIWYWQPENLGVTKGEMGGIVGAIVGAASIFVAYEGFQLLTYDYNDIEKPKKTLIRMLPIAIVVVIIIYVLVALGTASLIGASTIIEKKEVALAVAGEAAFGTIGKIIVTIAAAFSTGSAINATLFATARLTKKVAEDNELPEFLAKENKNGIPDRAVFILGITSAILAVIGSLSDLVEAASLVFLFTFAVVNIIAVTELKSAWRWVSLAGAICAGAAAIVLTVRLFEKSLMALGVLFAIVIIAVFVRPWILKKNDSSN